MKIRSVAVLGAGQMGAGIAQVASCSGLPVVMIDIQQKYIDRGIGTIEKSLSKLVSKDRMSRDEADVALSLVSTSVTREAASDVDLVIEAIPEVKSLKISAFEELDKICKETAFECNLSEHIDLDLWRKYVLIGTTAASTVLFQKPLGEISATTYGKSLIKKIHEQCRNIVLSKGCLLYTSPSPRDS